MSDPVQSKKSGFHYAYLIVASGIAITCIPCALVLSCAGIYFTPVSDYFGVPKAVFTLYFSILNIFMMLTLPIAGRLMSKMDLRLVLSVCVGICGIGLICMSFLNAVWEFYIVGAMLGIGVSPLIYLAVPTLINAWCREKIGFFIGLCMAFTGIGGVIFNPVGTALIAIGAEGWRVGYLVFGIIVLVVTLPFTLFIVRSNPAEKGLEPYGRKDSAAQNHASSARKLGVSASKAMKTTAFAALAAFCGIITINQTVYQFIPSYCQSFSDSIPEIAAISGAVASACMAGQAIGKVILGAINDKSIKGGMGLGIGGGIVGALLMWFIPFQTIILMVGAFLFGFVYACTTVQTPLLTREVFGSRDYTNIYARVSMVGALASAFAAVFWGWIIDLPHGFSLMFALSLICMVASFLLGLFALFRGKKLEKTAE